METRKEKKEELEFELRVLPPPTVPPVSWADYADVGIRRKLERIIKEGRLSQALKMQFLIFRNISEAKKMRHS